MNKSKYKRLICFNGNLSFLRNLFLIYSMFFIVGCSKIDEYLLEKKAAEHMLDPSSAQFKNVYVVDDTDGKKKILCGEVNGKNTFGAYTGYKLFYYYENIDTLYIEKEPLEGKWMRYFQTEQAERVMLTTAEASAIYGIHEYEFENSIFDRKLIEYTVYKNWKEAYQEFCESGKN